MDPLERAKSKQRDVAERTTISIPLALLEDLIQEIEELRELVTDEHSVETIVETIRKLKEGTDAKAPEVHGRARLRPVGGHEGRPGADGGGQHGPDDAA